MLNFNLALIEGVGGLDEISTALTGVFAKVSTVGVKMVVTAIGVGLTFIGAKWLWRKTKQWLSAV